LVTPETEMLKQAKMHDPKEKAAAANGENFRR
jgi:hypothetical protein